MKPLKHKNGAHFCCHSSKSTVFLKFSLKPDWNKKVVNASLSWFHPESSLIHTRLESEAKERSGLLFIWLPSPSPLVRSDYMCLGSTSVSKLIHLTFSPSLSLLHILLAHRKAFSRISDDLWNASSNNNNCMRAMKKREKAMTQSPHPSRKTLDVESRGDPAFLRKMPPERHSLVT